MFLGWGKGRRAILSPPDLHCSRVREGGFGWYWPECLDQRTSLKVYEHKVVFGKVVLLQSLFSEPSAYVKAWPISPLQRSKSKKRKNRVCLQGILDAGKSPWGLKGDFSSQFSLSVLHPSSLLLLLHRCCSPPLVRVQWRWSRRTEGEKKLMIVVRRSLAAFCVLYARESSGLLVWP